MKKSADFQRFLVEKLLEQPKSSKLNSRAFMLDALEVLMHNKVFSRKVLNAVYEKVLPTCKDPILMKKLFGRQGVDFKG